MPNRREDPRGREICAGEGICVLDAGGAGLGVAPIPQKRAAAREKMEDRRRSCTENRLRRPKPIKFTLG